MKTMFVNHNVSRSFRRCDARADSKTFSVHLLASLKSLASIKTTFFSLQRSFTILLMPHLSWCYCTVCPWLQICLASKIECIVAACWSHCLLSLTICFDLTPLLCGHIALPRHMYISWRHRRRAKWELCINVNPQKFACILHFRYQCRPLEYIACAICKVVNSYVNSLPQYAWGPWIHTSWSGCTLNKARHLLDCLTYLTRLGLI